MKTFEEIERESRANCGRYHEDTNSYDVLSEPKEYIKCDCCCGFIEIDEGEKAFTVEWKNLSNKEIWYYCEKCFKMYLEDEAKEQIKAEEQIINKSIDRINEIKLSIQELKNKAS